MELCSIASGSSGNSIYTGTERTRLLIDAGISKKRIEEGLASIGIFAGDIDGILITHEHSDHVRGLGVMSRRYGIPIYATQGTIDAVLKDSSLGELDEDLFCPIRPQADFVVGDITVHPIAVSHDAAEPVAFILRSAKDSVGVITDLGYYDQSVVDSLQSLDVLLLEANHDIHMLEVGTYPYYLKQRILGSRGHLSNEACGQLINLILHDGLKRIILGHLSRENNYPQLAYETVRAEITMGDTKYKGTDFAISVAKRDQISELIEI